MDKQQLDALEAMRTKVVDEFQRASAKLYMPNVRDVLMEFPALLAIAREHEQLKAHAAHFCQDDHPPIRHAQNTQPEELSCPVCAEKNAHEQTQRDLAAAREEIDELRSRVHQLRERLAIERAQHEASIEPMLSKLRELASFTPTVIRVDAADVDMGKIPPTPGAQR